MTSSPTPSKGEGSDSAESSRPSPSGFTAATIEGLVRYDEASPEVIARLEREPGALAVLKKLRAADAYLQDGGLQRDLQGALVDSGPKSEVTPDELFAFGRGELAPVDAEVVREHLAQAPNENKWVESLRGSTPPSTLTWDKPEEVPADEPVVEGSQPAESQAESPSILPGPGSQGRFPAWLAWTPLAAAALILAMAIGDTDRRSVLDGALPNSPIMRSASTDALLFPRGRVIGSTETVRTYASQPLFEVTPVAGANRYSFELRRITGQDVFAEGESVWESTATSHHATAPELAPGKYTWTAAATVQGIERALGSLNFTVLPAGTVDRSLLVRASTGQSSPMPGVLREDVRRLHASGFLTDARSKARALPPGEERNRYLAVPSER